MGAFNFAVRGSHSESPPEEGDCADTEDPAEQLVADTASGEGAAYEPKQDVTVLDLFRDVASVVVRSEPFTEYLHLGRFGDRWLIVNAFYLSLV